MNRLERECLAASLVLHTLLMVVLVVGAGFASPQKATEEVALATFIPDQLVDAAMMGGGTPAAQPPAAQAQAVPPAPIQAPPPQPKPQTPEPEPDPPRVAEPAKATSEPPVKAKPAAKKPEPEPEPPPSPEGEKPAAPRRIEPNLKPVTRSPDRAKADREKAAAEERARGQAEARRLADIREQRVSGLVSGLQQNLSRSTTVSVPGTGGATYASYTSYVDLVYRSAWATLKPREATDKSASVQVRVVIAKDGTILASEVRRRSGNAALDRSVRAALDRVRTIGRPFPEGARDTQREFDIEFNLESTGAAG